jgi:FkbM family methyltransferase
MITLTKTNFGDFYVFPHDSVSKVLFSNQFWDISLQPLFDKYVKQDSICIDIGANCGFHTIYLAKKCKFVYGVEAIYPVFLQLSANVFINKCWNVKLFHGAASDKEDLYYHDNIDFNDYEFISSTHLQKTNPKNNYSRGIILDNCISSDHKISLIKTDAQGMDLLALKGLGNTILRDKPIIIFEFEGELAFSNFTHTWPEYLAFFKGLNYSLERIDNSQNYLAIYK